VYLLVFHAYINKMQVQEAKSPVTNLVSQRCAEGFNSGVKGLNLNLIRHRFLEGQKLIRQFYWSLIRNYVVKMAVL
jgi:hypothetical protein